MKSNQSDSSPSSHNSNDRSSRAAARKNGTGPLRKVIEQARLKHGYSMTDLTVLAIQNDPYRQDTPAGHEVAKWFAEQIERFVPYGTVHLRGLHYLISSSSDVLKVNGKPYENNDADWTWLQSDAAKAARWLGYVSWDRIVDQRNERPKIYVPDQETSIAWKPGEGAFIQMPVSAEAALPKPSANFKPRQAYRIILFGEKTSLESVLLPVAQQVGGELLLPTGESSDAMVAEMASRIAEDGRPAVILYFSDFDPSGWQMAVSVARKLQAHRDLVYSDLAAQIHPVAMSLAQVRLYGLPSTPLKETEKRGDRWRTVMGCEQTEVDAMIALHPDELRAIARDAVRPFYDRTLERRTDDAQAQWEQEAAARMQAHPAYQEALSKLSAAIDALREASPAGLRDASTEFETTQLEVAGLLETSVELPEIVLPEPEIDTSSVPRPLFTTDDDYVTATRRLIDHKKLNGEHE
jgi:hypothetical protein